MDMIKKELEQVVIKIEENLKDPFPKNALKNFVISGSKLVRSKLAILYLKAHNIEITDNIYNILVAGEIVHNSSLLHDDVIDNADSRRGKTTISKEYSSNISILGGDYLLTFAIEQLLSLNKIEILFRFKDCIKKMTEAEIKQYFFRGNIPTKEEYFEICKGKTAELFSTILETCAIVSNLDSTKAKNFGEIFGICFQIKNDLNKDSAELDKVNGIYTAEKILGIEKTQNLLDNYKEEMVRKLEEFPNTIYKQGIRDLIREL